MNAPRYKGRLFFAFLIPKKNVKKEKKAAL